MPVHRHDESTDTSRGLSPSTFAQMIAICATSALPIHIFSPLRTHPSPSRTGTCESSLPGLTQIPARSTRSTPTLHPSPLVATSADVVPRCRRNEPRSSPAPPAHSPLFASRCPRAPTPASPLHRLDWKAQDSRSLQWLRQSTQAQPSLSRVPLESRDDSHASCTRGMNRQDTHSLTRSLKAHVLRM